MASSSWFARMTGSALTLDNLQQVLILQLRDLLSAEEQLIEALPKMADAADASALKARSERCGPNRRRPVRRALREIAGYGCARTFALRLGNKYLAKVLQQTLNEEVGTAPGVT
jgi:ferritin-like metal-binding protein YciE